MKALALTLSLALIVSACGEKAEWKSPEKIRVNGVRLDPGFMENGVLHLGLSATDKDGKDLLIKEETQDFKDIEVKLATAPASGSSNSRSKRKSISVRLELVTGVSGKGELPIYSNILVDNSGSNESTDPQWTRMEAASRAVKSFCTGASSRVYLGLFGDGPTNGFRATRVEATDTSAVGSKALLKECGNQTEIDKLLAAIGQVKSRGAGGGTPLYEALRENIEFLMTTESEIGPSQKVVLLTSDGQPTDTGKRTEDYPTFVAQSGVTIFTVGYGPSAPVTVDGKQNATLDKNAISVLQEIAQWSNGYYLPLTQTADLENHIGGLTSALNNGYISVKMVVDVTDLEPLEVVVGKISISGKSDTFSFLTPGT